MNLALLFARRYLLAKRSRNAINVITFISIVVVAVVTAAMVVVLSTLNGISEVVEGIYSPFDQDLTITAAEGKTFDRDSLPRARIMALPGIGEASWIIEENVLLRSGEQQAVATMKGVEPDYLVMSALPEHMYIGEPVFDSPNGPLVILGAALKDELDVPLNDDVMRTLEISAPVRGRKLLRYKEQAFEQERVAVAGAFTINLEFDQQYVLAPIQLADSLLHYGGAVSALEIHLQPKTNPDQVAKEVRALVGDRFSVRTRHQKNALMYTTNATEKWFTFAVLAFIGLIGAFNIIASLTLMMIEKRQDMLTLAGMGAAPSFVRRVFLNEGLLIVLVGTIGGLLLGLLVCGIQAYTGIVSLSDSVVPSYPVKVLPGDLLLIFCSVFCIGALATWVPLRQLSKRYLQPVRA
jgi:ABC-type lipoprotein release transport system permease subunit